MTDSVSHTTPEGVPAPDDDRDNPALIDAQKTFAVTLAGGALFILAMLFIILRTRMG